MAEPESQRPHRWSQAGWGGLGAGLFSERSTVPVACLLFLQGFPSVVWKKGLYLLPETNIAQLDACPCYGSSFSCFCHGDGLFGPASP